jgi:hypothetical protein
MMIQTKTQIYSLKKRFHMMHTYRLGQYAVFAVRIKSARQFSLKL